MTTSLDNPYLPLDLVTADTQLILAVGTYKRLSFFFRAPREALRGWWWRVIGSWRRRCFAYPWANVEAYDIEVQHGRLDCAYSDVRRTTPRGTARMGDGFVEAVCCSVDLFVESINLGSEVRETSIQCSKEIHDVVQLFVPLPSPYLCLW